jgi:hypothetical protein
MTLDAIARIGNRMHRERLDDLDEAFDLMAEANRHVVDYEDDWREPIGHGGYHNIRKPLSDAA